MRDWLHQRGLHDDTLRANLVGADPGRHYLPRPRRGFPAGWPAVVYPALDVAGRPVYFQARYLDPPPHRDKYDNPSRHWATNPRVAWGRCPTGSTATGSVVATEGIADALIAAQSGFRAVGVLGSSYPDRAVARQIEDELDAGTSMIICFDSDTAGVAGAKRLAEACDRRHSVLLQPPSGMDLTDWAQCTPDWFRPIQPERTRTAGASDRELGRHDGLRLLR